MQGYLFLFGAIIFEVIGTLLLPITAGFTRILPTVFMIICYVISFYFLSITVQSMAISIVYAIWSATGVFLITIFSYLFFKQALNWQIILGLFLIVSGVVLVSLYKT